MEFSILCGILFMIPIEMKQRTKQFTLQIIDLVESLPRGRTLDVIAKQLLRAGTSVGANYRAACRGRSSADFIAKLGIVEEELDETMFWMELLVESNILKSKLVDSLLKEANELLAITVASIKTTRANRFFPQSSIRHPK
jgi:four helix bundle protein